MLGLFSDCSSGATLREYIYNANQQVGFIVTSGSTSTLYYVHTDQLGTPQVVTNQAKSVVFMADYQPFGKLNLGQANSIELYSRFPGQYVDSATGNYYNYFRDYDPSIGRYIESDPIGLGGGINTYAYVGGNPIKYVDPIGLYQCTYSISRHTMSCVAENPEHADFGSSNWTSGNNTDAAHPNCRDNPACQNVPFHGPTPQGGYTIGEPTVPGGGRRPLIPDAGTDTLGRNAFQSHGCTNPATCSEGCLAATTNATRDEYNNAIHTEPHSHVTIVE